MSAGAKGAAGVLLLVLLMACSALVTWQWQANRYGKQLADRQRDHQADLSAISNAAAAQVRREQEQRQALEQRLATNDLVHFKALRDEQTLQDRLRDRLATADLRLSVQLAGPGPAAGGQSMPASAGAGGVVHGGARGELDPAAAQRIVAITGAGDDGLIALAACQAYVREVTARPP